MLGEAWNLFTIGIVIGILLFAIWLRGVQMRGELPVMVERMKKIIAIIFFPSLVLFVIFYGLVGDTSLPEDEGYD